MSHYFKTRIGRLRLLGILEGWSLIILMFLGVPLKHMLDSPLIVKVVGPIHGVLFLMFVFFAFTLSVEEKWSFSKVTWKVLVSSLIPFGTFYVDKKILSKLHT